MSDLKHLFANNRAWAATLISQDPDFFQKLSGMQSPQYLWIGCADSRVPANQIIGLLPGEVIVHRNIANLVVHSDLNCLSVVQYAVAVLKVRHIIVCGHYGCGGVQAAMARQPLGLIDNWLRHLKDVYQRHADELDGLEHDQRLDRYCELNVMAQVLNVCHTTIVQAAWERGQELTVHGWVYSLADGLLQDLKVSRSSAEGLDGLYKMSGDPDRVA
jgi:carbonic anhydrase